jgi:hypothetical protein
LTAVRAIPALLALAALVATPAAAALPTRAQVQAALNTHEACRGAGNLACYPALHYRIGRSRCERLNDPYDPGRILCFYWGVLSGRSAPPHRLNHDCAYFRRDSHARWRVDAYPDADMCE